MVKKWLFLAVVLPAACMFAQDAGPGPQIPSNTAPPLLQRPYEAVRDFFNFYALANAIFDSNGYYNSIGGSSGSSAGIMVGGGATGFHQF
ncbi:MAG: hypothetical protein JO061_01390, partial [Acidobacteriaceae bacterium]|nr:hypothetical protein [Acidobacteriaceae bacterium]